MATAKISQSGSLRAALGTDLLELESVGGVSAHAAASSIGGLMPANTLAYAQLANMAAAGVLGATAAGAVVALTPTQATALLDAFTSALKGLVPASGGGTANFLRADGTWAAPAAGAKQLIQTITTSGSQATVDFTSIPATFKHLELEWVCRDTKAGTGCELIRLKFNGDNTAVNYVGTSRYGTDGSSSFGSNVAATGSGVLMFGLSPQDSNTAGIVGVGTVKVMDYAGTAWFKQFNGCYGVNAGSTTQASGVSGRWSSLVAINQLTVTTDGTAFKNGSAFSLYGILG